MTIKTVTILFVLAWRGAAGLLFAQELTFKARGLEAIKGRLDVIFYHPQKTSMEESLVTLRVDVVMPTLSILCEGLPADTYTVTLLQDESRNGRLDITAFGVPMEGYGFNNDTRGVMGPPSYDKYALYFTRDTTSVIRTKQAYRSLPAFSLKEGGK